MAEDSAATSLSLSTLLLVEELWGGDALVAPVADPSQASCGEETESLIEQEMFLAEFLGRVAPEVIARYAMPDGAQLRTVSVLIPREDLPQRLAIRTPIAVPCLVVPAPGGDAWVVALPLRYTLYVTAEEDLTEAVKSEVLRMVAAQELGAQEYLRLLPAKAQRLERLSVVIDRPDAVPAGRAASLRKALLERHKRKQAAEVLLSVARPWHTLEVPRRLRPIEGREAELKLLGALLGGDDRSGVALLGPEASGKTELLRAWFERERRDGRERLLYQTSGAQLIAGMSGLGQWQERIRRVFEAAEELDAILYFDNLGDLFAERVEGTVDLAGAMKVYLEQGRVRLVGELSPEMLELAEARQAGFLACLSRVKVEPLTATATARGLSARIAFDRSEEADKPTLEERAVGALVDLAERYLPYRAFPGKAFRLYEELRSVHGDERGADGKALRLTAEHLYEHFSMSSGVPAFLLRDDRTLRVDDVIRTLGQQLVGQREAVRRVAETVCVVKAGLQPSGKPLATFLFVGPTGVGKTELARALASYLFGSAERLVRFDMSEYMDGEAAERLIRGTDRADGLLTRRVREQPFCVLLLDEIEKASRGVFDLLLQVCGEGRLTDARGKVAYFHNAIIIMTSNLGAAHHRPAAGFGGASTEDEAYYARQVAASFRPEFVNRLDRVIAFRPLTAAEGERVARLSLERICARRGILDSGVVLGLSPVAVATLARGGYSERYGARALRRHLEDRLVAPVAKLLGGLGAAGRDVQVRVLAPGEPESDPDERIAGLDEGGFRFEVLRQRDGKASTEVAGVRRIAELRREARQLIGLGRVEQVREQIEFLVAQISYGSRGSKDKRSSQDISALQADLHRLSQCYEQLRNAVLRLETAEELALMALFEGEMVGNLLSEARAAAQEAHGAGVLALLALEPRRDAVTLRLTEVQSEGGLSMWLDDLLQILEARGWEASIHIDGDSSAYAGYWPRTQRRWGPPRSLEEFIGLLGAKDRDKRPKAGLLTCRGPYAGLLLALEAGVQRWLNVPDHPEKIALAIDLVALRTTLSDKEWGRVEVQPMPPAAQEEVKKLKSSRELDASTGRLKLQLPPVEFPRVGSLVALQDDVALAVLRRYELDDELDRDDLFAAPLDSKPTEPE